MNDFARKLWTENDGVLSFEWTLIVTLLVIGVVAGLSAARDAVIDELGDAAQAMLALDDSYVLDQPLRLQIDLDGAGPGAAVEPGSAAGSSFTDAQSFTDCGRTTAAAQNQAGESDTDS
jgi:Flp pilus assembly pilin Flp